MGNAGQMIESMPGKEGWEACNELPNLQRTSEPVAEILEQTTPLSFLARTQIKLVSGIGIMETISTINEDLSCTCSQSLTSVFFL